MGLSLNKDQIKILIEAMDSDISINELAMQIGKSKSYTSENVSSLAKVGLVRLEKRGLKNMVCKNDSELAMGLYLLMMENPNLDLDTVLTGSALTFLPWLVDEGMSKNDLIRYSGSSRRTVDRYLMKWRTIGIIKVESGKYFLNARYPLLTQLMKTLWRKINNDNLQREVPDGVMIWQWRDQYLFSVRRNIVNQFFIPCAITRLIELGNGLISLNKYYFHGTLIKELNLEEVLIQSYLVSEGDPRIKRAIRETIIKGNVDGTLLQYYEKKYAVRLVV
jgi:hypothetical protein